MRLYLNLYHIIRPSLNRSTNRHICVFFVPDQKKFRQFMQNWPTHLGSTIKKTLNSNLISIRHPYRSVKKQTELKHISIINCNAFPVTTRRLSPVMKSPDSTLFPSCAVPLRSLLCSLSTAPNNSDECVVLNCGVGSAVVARKLLFVMTSNMIRKALEGAGEEAEVVVHLPDFDSDTVALATVYMGTGEVVCRDERQMDKIKVKQIHYKFLPSFP
jgi:hypothetical protein